MVTRKSTDRPAQFNAADSKVLKELNSYAVNFAERHQLNEVDASLTALALRNEGLGLSKPTGDFRLREVTLPSRLS